MLQRSPRHYRHEQQYPKLVRRAQTRVFTRLGARTVLLSALSIQPIVACGGVSPEIANAFADPQDALSGVADQGSLEASSSGDTASAKDGDGAITVVDTSLDTPVSTVSNDRCSGAIPIVVSSGKYNEVKGDSTKALADYGSYGCHTAPGNDVVYALQHPGGDLWLDTFGSTLDTVVSLQTKCGDSLTEVACSSRTAGIAGSSRIAYRGLDKGTYYAIVDSVNLGAGGAFRLGYSAPGYSSQITCDTTPVATISDVALGGTTVVAGVDLYERVATTDMKSFLNFRSGPSGGDLCVTATGQQAIGSGAEQVYKLDLKSKRTLRITAQAVSPKSFTSSETGRFDILVYLRSADGAPEYNDVKNCKRSSGNSSDTCVPFGTDVEAKSGSYWLVVDSLLGSNGRFRLHIDIR